MDFTSLVTSLGTSFVVFVVLLLLYAWLASKEGNQVVYYPSRMLKGKAKYGYVSKTGNPLRWMVEAWRASEDDIIAAAGLDAAVYLAFIATALAIMVLSSAVCLPLLLPLSATDRNNKIQRQKQLAKDSKSASSYDDFDTLAMGNVQPKSNRLWGFLVAAYFVSFVTYFILWKTYKHVLYLRTREQASLEAKPEQFVVLVRDIPPVPPGKTRKEQVDSFFRKLHPDTFDQSLIVSDISEANKVWVKIEGYRKKLARAEFVFEESKTRPTHKSGFLGLMGKTVDSIDFYNEKIKDLMLKLNTKQKIALTEKQANAAFIIFNSRLAATAASQIVHSQLTDTWTITPAPEPRQVVWKNLTIPFYQRMIRANIIYIIVFLTIVFYMIPISFVSAFTTLDELRKLLPFLKWLVDNKALKSILEAYLPQLVLILFLAFLPVILMILSKAEGLPSKSQVVRAASGKYFYFIVFNVFLGVTIGGSLWASIKPIVKAPAKLVDILATSLPRSASFFISFVALKNFVGYGLELCRLGPLLMYHIKRRFLCKTEAELQKAWAPGAFGYATRVPNDMLILTISLSYSILAPMIIPFAILYFSVGWFVLRNQALNVYVPSYESYGRMWPHIQIRIIAALILSQLTMIGYFSLKEFVYSFLLIPLPFVSLSFGYLCKKRFYTSFCVTSLEVACNDVKEAPSLSSIVKAFTPPCLLLEDKFDDPERHENAHSTVPSRESSMVTSQA